MDRISQLRLDLAKEQDSFQKIQAALQQAQAALQRTQLNISNIMGRIDERNMVEKESINKPKKKN